MLNQVVMVGKIKEMLDNGFIVSVDRIVKSETGEYDNDDITVELTGEVLNNTKEYCQETDVVGIKGRLKNIDNNIIVVGEKISFLSTNNKDKQ